MPAPVEREAVASRMMTANDNDEPSTEELRTVAAEREHEERELLDESQTKDEADQHRRRADKQSYLREKLEERAEAERQAATDDGE